MLLKFGFAEPLELTNIKAVVDSGFLATMQSLESVNAPGGELGEDSEDTLEKYSDIYNEGINSFSKYVENPVFDPANLQKAAQKFAEALEISRSHAEPYFYLAYIFNHLQYKDLAKKFYEIAKLVNPRLKGLKSLTKYINSN